MSLKAIHLIFISSAILLGFLCAGWELKVYLEKGGRLHLGFSIGSLVVAVSLMVYGRLLLKKLRNISYL